MSAPFRIKRPDTVRAHIVEWQGPDESFRFYLDRLFKMIPAEIISLYLVGSGFIPSEQTIGLAAWAVVCLIGLFVIRAYGTADRIENKPPDWIHVIISAIAYVIWLYSIGGPFVTWGIYVPWIGSLLVLTWTFFVPLFYKGPTA